MGAATGTGIRVRGSNRVGRGDGVGSLASSCCGPVAVGHRDFRRRALSHRVDRAQACTDHQVSINRPDGGDIKDLTLGPVRLAARGPSVLWDGDANVVQIATRPLGFDGASEADRIRWLNGFRRLLDGLETPIEVLIESEPGTGADTIGSPPTPRDFDDMRSADIWFVEQTVQSPSAHRRTTSLVVPTREASRVEGALREMGVGFSTSAPLRRPTFGEERPHHLAIADGWSRTWYVERMPGTELEPGWIFRLIPPGLRVRLAWHADPLPVAWIVDYLQRQLTNMRASRMQELAAGTNDPMLAGALPNTEDLQRRLASSQEKAFHVSLYITLVAATLQTLEDGSERIRSAARAILCELQPCTFRMLDGHIATLPTGIDRKSVV